jgi:D-threonate/D-erythronate kinase
VPDLVVIADDLTGALDATAPFAMRGIATAVALTPSALHQAIATGARVVGVSTNSREIAADDAREAVRSVVEALPGGTQVFKKVDSRLKGNIAAELDAVPHLRSLMIPAIPAFGRWVKGGRLGGFGVVEPIDIASRLGHHAGAAIIPDIATQADIDAALDTPYDLPVGARGLAEAVARVMAPIPRLPDTSLPNAQAYCVIGSTDPITLAQLAFLRANTLDASYIAGPNGVGPAELPSPSRLTILQATAATERRDMIAVANALAGTLVRLDPQPGSLLVLSGGETAQIVLRRLGIHVLDLIGETLPGLPLARAGDLTVVTKSGGFGAEETLQLLFAPFRAQEERTA